MNILQTVFFGGHLSQYIFKRSLSHLHISCFSFIPPPPRFISQTCILVTLHIISNSQTFLSQFPTTQNRKPRYCSRHNWYEAIEGYRSLLLISLLYSHLARTTLFSLRLRHRLQDCSPRPLTPLVAVPRIFDIVSVLSQIHLMPCPLAW